MVVQLNHWTVTSGRFTPGDDKKCDRCVSPEGTIKEPS